VTTTTVLPDWGFVLLLHDGSGWAARHQDGRILWRNTDLGADQPTAARGWLAGLMVEHAELVPAGMGTAADMYGIHERDGQVEVRPVGGLGRDEQGWVVVDGLGHIVDRADGIDADDEAAANAWIERYYQSRNTRPADG